MRGTVIAFALSCFAAFPVQADAPAPIAPGPGVIGQDPSGCDFSSAPAVEITEIHAHADRYYGRCFRLTGYISTLNREIATLRRGSTDSEKRIAIGVYYRSGLFRFSDAALSAQWDAGPITLVGRVGDCRDFVPIPADAVVVDGPYCDSHVTGPYVAFEQYRFDA